VNGHTGAAQKSPEAFRTISEVAADLDVPQHVLRFWETKFATVKPLKRGGGRRYYRPDDLDLLKGIRSLLYSDGLTIKGVQKILREQVRANVMELGRGSTSLIVSRRAANDEARRAKRHGTSRLMSSLPRDTGSDGGLRKVIGALHHAARRIAGLESAPQIARPR